MGTQHNLRQLAAIRLSKALREQEEWVREMVAKGLLTEMEMAEHWMWLERVEEGMEISASDEALAMERSHG